MRKLVNKTISSIPPSGIRKFFDIAAEMEDVISLGVGEPDFDTPWHIREEGIYSLEKGKTFYTSNAGLMELRQQICQYLNRRFQMTYTTKEVLVTVGGSEGIDLALRAVIEPGDEVLIPEPCFVSYKPCSVLAGAVPVAIPLKEENEFKLTAEEILEHVTDKTRVLFLPFPNNPTGATMNREELSKLVDVIIEKDLFVISDEIYAELTYGENHCSIASLPGMRERTLIINGFSKAYAMTGWRMGFAVGPEELISAMTKIHQYAIMCTPTTSQYAAVEALKNGDEDVKEMCKSYNHRRNFLVKSLNDMGLKCFEPKGAFYVFPNITSTGLTSEEFCTGLLYNQSVAVVPGTAFGDCGEGFIRVSYASSMDALKTAIKRIQVFVNEIEDKKRNV